MNPTINTKIYRSFFLKFIYCEKATKFCEIFTLLLTVCTLVKSKVKISQNFVAFSEYMNFNKSRWTPNFLAFLVRKLERTTTSALYNSKRNKWNLAHNEIRILLTMWALKLTIYYIKSLQFKTVIFISCRFQFMDLGSWISSLHTFPYTGVAMYLGINNVCPGGFINLLHSLLFLLRF